MSHSEASKWREFMGCILHEGFWVKCEDSGDNSTLTRFVLTVLPESIPLLENFRDKGMKLCPAGYKRGVWETMLSQGRGASVDFIAKNFTTENGLRLPDQTSPRETIVVRPGTPIEAVKMALASGLNLSLVDVRCARELLLKSAELGLRPAYEKSYGPFDLRQPWEQDRVAQGMEYICEKGDLGLLEAFLKRSVTDGLDLSTYRIRGKTDVVDLLAAYGIPEILPTLKDGSIYVDPATKVATIPEGVERIERDAFREVTSVTEINLPSTIKKIGDRGFALRRIDDQATPSEVAVPKGATEIGYGAFFGTERIVVFDTVNPDAKYELDEINGETKATVGWLGVRPNGNYALCAAPPNADPSDFEVEVRSAETGETKFRVWMPMEGLTRKPRCIYASSWGPNAEFKFENVDCLFDRLPRQADKMRAALNRLRWPVGLSKADESKMQDFLANKAVEAIKMLCADDGSELVPLLLSASDLSKTATDRLIAYANENDRAPKIAALLKEYRISRYRSAPAAKARNAKRRATAQQDAARALELLEQGDASWLSELEGRSLRSVRPQTTVALFEAAACVEDVTPTETLYRLFGPPEFDSLAFANSIRFGNTDVALMLHTHGANLQCEIRSVGVPKDTPEKAQRRRDYYAGRNTVLSRAIPPARSSGDADDRSEESYRTLQTIQQLIDEDALDEDELKLICLGNAASGHCDLALSLVELGANDSVDGCITVYGRRAVEIRFFEDLLYPGCSPETARFVCRVRPQSVPVKWRAAFLEAKEYPETVKELVPYLSGESFRGDKQSLRLMLASHGWVDELRLVTAWDGFSFTEDTLSKALDSAAEDVEMTAFLLKEQERLSNGKQGAPLELG